jgi:hypothetical protein
MVQIISCFGPLRWIHVYLQALKASNPLPAPGGREPQVAVGLWLAFQVTLAFAQPVTCQKAS